MYLNMTLQEAMALQKALEHIYDSGGLPNFEINLLRDVQIRLDKLLAMDISEEITQ